MGYGVIRAVAVTVCLYTLAQRVAFGAHARHRNRAEDARRGATFAEASEAKDRALRGTGGGV